MTKLPILDTVRFAFEFTFGQIGTIIGLIWIPAVINVVAEYFATRNYDAGVMQMAQSGTVGLPHGFGLYMLCLFGSVLLASINFVSVARQALGLRQGPALAQFALGGVEFRVFGAVLALNLLAVLFALGMLLAVKASDSAIAAFAPNIPGIQAVSSIIALVGLGAIAFALVRLSFLFVPGAIVDGDFGIAKSWELTQRNFWRIFAVMLIIGLPLIIFVGIVERAILGEAYFASVAASMTDQTHAVKYMIEQARITDATLPVRLGFEFAVTPITIGLFVGSAAFAYRVLSGKRLAEER